MKVIIAGDRNCKDYATVEKVVKESGFEITEVVSGGAKGVDKVGEKWAEFNNVPVVQFKAEWDNLTQPGARIKTRQNPWNKRLEKYNASAGFYRNQQMAKYADALILIQIFGETPGSQDMLKKAKDQGLKIYEKEKPDENYSYFF